MGYGVNKGNHRISLEPFDGSDNWVDIKASRSYGAAQRQKAAGLKMKGIGSKAPTTLDFDFAESNITMFLESIVAWSLKAEETDAEVMPLEEKTFREVLDGPVGEWLGDEIQAYYSARAISDDERKNSNGRSTAPLVVS